MILQHSLEPDLQVREKESNDATTALSDGADFERLEDKDQVPTTEGCDTLGRDGGRDKVANVLPA